MIFVRSLTLVALSALVIASGPAWGIRFADTPTRLQRDDLGGARVPLTRQPLSRFTALDIQRLQSLLYTPANLPFDTRNKLNLQQQRLGRTNLRLIPGQRLPINIFESMVWLPPQLSNFLGLNNTPLRIGVLGSDVVLYNTRTQVIQDVLPNFVNY